MTVYRFCLVFLLLYAISCSPDDSTLPEDSEKNGSLPELITYEISDITLYSAKAGGKLINSGNSDVIELGLVVGYESLPTIENASDRFPLVADPTGEFTALFTRIPAKQTYYVRAYGISSNGVGYGNEVQFTSPDENILNENITLSTQEEVVNFGTFGYTTIGGTLKITGTVTDLSPLKSIVILNDGIEISGTDQLKTLKGLENLKIVGNILPHGVRISGNMALESLEGLNGLDITRGDFEIVENDKLVNLQGLNNYRASSAGDFLIENCDGLQSLQGLEKFIFVGGSLYLRGNSILDDISSLNNLGFVGFRIQIARNSNLQNLNGLENLTSVEGVELVDNDVLTNLDGLSNLISIPEIIYIAYNDVLNDLTPFQNITEIKNLTIEGNDALVNLNGFDNLRTIGYLYLNDNSSMTSLKGIESLHSLQSLEIYSNKSLYNLDGLNGLNTIQGSSYPIKIAYNNHLTSLSGLENLSVVEGFIQVFNNQALTDFCALKFLFEIDGHDGDVSISDNQENPSVIDIINFCN